MDGRSTIAAIASAPGAGERGVLRTSGPASARVVEAVFRAPGRSPLGEGRGLYAGRFLDGRGEQPALLLWTPGPRSYTREDVAEFHLPGSPPLLAAGYARLVALGCEPAAPGEFTRRAFLSGRLDLTRAEGVLELVGATNEAERRAAAALLGGGLAVRVAALRERLVDLRALAEASLDFDEAETGHVPREELAALAREARTALAEALRWEERRAPLSAAPRVVLAGAPNAGKSTLFNRLVRDRSAIASEHAGTTRDALVGPWWIGEVECVLVDGPGLDPGARGIDAAAQALAERGRAAADLCVWVVDARRARGGAEREALAAERALLPAGAGVVLAWAQTDRADALAQPPSELAARAGSAVAVSARTGEGLAELERAVAAGLALGGEGGAVGREDRQLSSRHRRALARSLEELDGAIGALAEEEPADLVAERLRGAALALDDVEGRTLPEDLLDRIFARFCIGK